METIKQRPRLRVSTLIKDENKFLLVEESLKSRGNKLFWCMPGGGVEYMEKIENAAKREAKEETGLDVEVLKFIMIFERIVPEENLHSVTAIFLAKPLNRETKKEANATNLQWFTRDEALKLNLTDSVKEVLSEKRF